MKSHIPEVGGNALFHASMDLIEIEIDPHAVNVSVALILE